MTVTTSIIMQKVFQTSDPSQFQYGLHENGGCLTDLQKYMMYLCTMISHNIMTQKPILGIMQVLLLTHCWERCITCLCVLKDAGDWLRVTIDVPPISPLLERVWPISSLWAPSCERLQHHQGFKHRASTLPMRQLGAVIWVVLGSVQRPKALCLRCPMHGGLWCTE